MSDYVRIKFREMEHVGGSLTTVVIAGENTRLMKAVDPGPGVMVEQSFLDGRPDSRTWFSLEAIASIEFASTPNTKGGPVRQRRPSE